MSDAVAPEGLRSPDRLLSSWEEARRLDDLARGLALWHAAVPSAAIDDLARAPIGRRDRALLEVRMATFGSAAECFDVCPACGEELEFDLDLNALVMDAPSGDAPAGEGVGGVEPAEIIVDDWQVAFRLPGTADLEGVRAAEEPTAALLDRCVLGVRHNGETVDGASLPPTVARAVEDEMARLDPQAEVSLDLRCAACRHSWPATFDIAAFLWREVDVTARRLLSEVDVLARTYGWSEDAILSLSPARRRAYLELAVAG